MPKGFPLEPQPVHPLSASSQVFCSCPVFGVSLTLSWNLVLFHRNYFDLNGKSIALKFLLAYYPWSPNPQKKATSEWGISSPEWAGTVRSLQTCLAWCHLVFLAGWYEGERLRDGERGWFPMECAKEITCQATIDKNVERMGRLLGLETNV